MTNAKAAKIREEIRSLRRAIETFVRVYCDEADEVVYLHDAETDQPYCPKCGSSSHLTIYAENERCLTLLLPMHRGALHGIDGLGLADVEFPTLRHATSFVETLRDPSSARLRDPQIHFDLPVVVQVKVSREERIFPSAREVYRSRAAFR